jgi:hypothetical protein
MTLGFLDRTDELLNMTDGFLNIAHEFPYIVLQYLDRV